MINFSKSTEIKYLSLKEMREFSAVLSISHIITVKTSHITPS
jgi:hypothetical protein